MEGTNNRRVGFYCNRKFTLQSRSFPIGENSLRSKDTHIVAPRRSFLFGNHAAGRVGRESLLAAPNVALSRTNNDA